MNKETPSPIDFWVVAAGNLFNLLMVFVFLFRLTGIEYDLFFCVAWIVMSLFFFISAVINLGRKRGWWSFVIPLVFALFLVLEIVLDYILKLDFRSTSLLGPYLLMYYLSILLMIGYGFLTKKKYGYVTLATYFMSQIAALISYFYVGHG